MRIIKQVRNRILRDIYRIPVFRVRYEQANKASREKYVSNLPILSPTDLNVVENLRREGVFVTSLEALNIPSTPLLLHAAKTLIPKIPTTAKKNDYVVHASSEQILEYPEIFLWGIEERILNIVENFIGLPVPYHGSYFRRDIANTVQKKTRL